MSGLSRDCDVLIAGAGPAGMSAALSIHKQGLKVRLIDKQNARSPYSRATLVNPHTLELLEPFGVAQNLRARGQEIKTFGVYDLRGEKIISTALRRNAAEPAPLKLPQLQTEACLEDALSALGVRIERPVELYSYVETDVGLRAYVGPPGADGAQDEISARFLIGADGVHSRVRAAADINYPLERFPHKIEAMDAEADWEHDHGNSSKSVSDHDVTMWLGEQGSMTAFRLGAELTRFIGVGLDHMMKNPNMPKIKKVLWSSQFDVGFAVAERFGVGRIWLAGDAAHVHSPIGGRGMNIGIADGLALGPALAHGDLNGYDKARREIASEWVGVNETLTKALISPGPGAAMRLSAIRQGLHAAHAVVGDQLGDFLFRHIAGI